MHARLALAILALQCFGICAPIRVPIMWDGGDSEVNSDQEHFSVEQFKPQNVRQKPIPVEYFEYTAKKPQFAVDIASFHGVQSPEYHYTAHPVRPFTGKEKPALGKHRIQDENRPVFHQFQDYIHHDEIPVSHVTPITTEYGVFHPYKSEEPGLQELYKDPILDKIRNDIRDSSQRLEIHENEAGKPDISKEEYLESLEQTDFKKPPQKNIPAPYEIHRPQRRPIYYRPVPKYSNRDHVLNQRFRHPWNQNFVKIRPLHYRPLKNHIHKLRQHHALTYEDERNEYPQVPTLQPYEEPSDGYDIYETGKAKYINLRNNLDESVNNLVKDNHPVVSQKLELQKDESPEDEEEKEFVPIKNYAQIRKTETTRHLPKEAAFDEAENYEEIKNAPRLREAIKSTKAQTVYTEEGYEDSAYDHAGEQKHASDSEAHGGLLREHELSGGKYKIPSVSASYKDGNGSAYKDQIVHGKKWNDNNKDNYHEEDSDDYSENEHEELIDADSYRNGPINYDDNKRDKRQHAIDSESESGFEIDNKKNNQTHKMKEEHILETDVDSIVEDDENNAQSDTRQNIDSSPITFKEDTANIANKTSQHDMNKRETKFKVPEIDLDSTYLTEKDILQIAKEKIIKDDLTEKYPYYFKNLKSIHKDSPLKYAENLKLIPKKSKGGTEFYDSRSQLECPEVDDKVDALPEKFKKNGHPDEPEEGETDEKNDEQSKESESMKAPPRLEGLGDKIDCFKAKYFGKNPLDSPFFKEDIISSPDPVGIPNMPSFHLKSINNPPMFATASDNIAIKLENLKKNSDEDIYAPLDKLKSDQNSLKETLTTGHLQTAEKITPNRATPINITSLEKNYVSYDMKGFENSTSSPQSYPNLPHNSDPYKNRRDNIEPSFNVTIATRKKRSVPFLYEPYKIIRDIQTPDSKKTTTTGNISPLIKQLQTSKVIDAVVKSNNDKDQLVKQSTKRKIYKDIGKKERENIDNLDPKDSSRASFVDVNVDKRRGEPRYELRPLNHKAEYSPVTNKKSISLEEYKAQANPMLDKNNLSAAIQSTVNSRKDSTKSNGKVSNNFHQPEEFQNLAASSTIKRTVATSSPTVINRREQSSAETKDDDDSEEDYDDDDYEDDDEDDREETSTTTTTTTTTTPKPLFRKRIRTTTTTENPSEKPETEQPTMLRLVTRFRNHNVQNPDNPKDKEKHDDIPKPKLREKKKKTTKSTIVTDTQKYGDGEDDMRQEEIDALIGVKQDMRDYMPLYEKEAEKKTRKNAASSEEDESDENDEDDDVYEKDDEDEEEEDEDDDDDDEIDEEDIESELIQNVSTTEPSKRTLSRTTDAPHSTTETRSSKIKNLPIISTKKIEIHKELPVNKTSPHVTQFKQDIKELEIIREIPRKISRGKPKKNVEVLDLYKDDNLATEINKLGAVEIFKENLDLNNGPKHGGNYKLAPTLKEEISTESPTDLNNHDKAPKDAEVSQTENKKLIELDDSVPSRSSMHGGNLKYADDTIRSNGNRGNSKHIEFKDFIENENTKSLHGGNLKERGRKRGESRSEKLIELDDHDDEDDDSASEMHGGNFKSYGGSRNNGRAMHGGNYRRSKLIQADNVNDESTNRLQKAKSSAAKKLNSADLLVSLAQAVPILTTTPAYILDPSKRMYYYVDA